VEVIHSAQRLAWNTLDQLRVDYEIKEVCSSPHNALKSVKNEKNLLTFQNRSFMSPFTNSFTVSDILARDTSHVIGIVLYNQKDEIKDFSKFIQGRGQKIIEEWGFKRID